MPRRLRYGMIGGGRGAFIGAVHRVAAQMDNQVELVAGAFSSDPARAKASAEDLHVAPARAYGSYAEMIQAEAAMPADRRLDFVVIVTPNHEHVTPAIMALEAGFHVVLDKPLAHNVDDALRLRDAARKSDRLFALTHNYSGNVMVKQARALVRTGVLGDIRKVVVEYSQGWLTTRVEEEGQKQAVWRTDPARNGAGGLLGDIGSHAEHLVRYVTGLQITDLCADLTTFLPGRSVADDGNILLRFANGAKGVLHVSQIAVGEDNNFNLRVYGSRASVEWHQEYPEDLIVKYLDQPRQIQRRGNGYIDPAAARFTRIPNGHPEGYLEAFSNLYREAYRAISALSAGQPLPADLDLPTIDDGIDGMLFIEAALESAKNGSTWVAVPRASARV